MTNERRTVIQMALVLGTVAVACAGPGGGVASAAMRDQVGAYEVEVLVDGMTLPTFAHRGESFVMGHKRERYVLRVHNRSHRRIEAVVTVDGLDVIDGKAGAFSKRGYLVPAWGSVDIDGWRLSNQQVAAFRFSSVSSSYAGQTGQPRNVGVIGVAVFPERMIVRPRPRYIPYRRVSPPWDMESKGGIGSGRSSAPSHDEAAPAPQSAPAASAEMDAYRAEAEEAPRKRSMNRPGLGTQFGEQHDSSVQEVTFVRANASHPETILGVRYNDRRGLVAMGVDVNGSHAWSDADLRRSANPFPRSAFAQPPRGWNGN